MAVTIVGPDGRPLLNVGGDLASGVTDSGNPVKIGGRAQGTAPTAVTTGQRANAWLGLNGQQVVTLADLLGTAATFRPDGEIKVAMDGSTLILDTFETLDTTNTWTLGGTVVPTGATGALTVSAGTAASAQSSIRSQATFVNGATAFLNYVSTVMLEAGAVTGNKRVWGLGIPLATPTVAAPITNGVVFELQDTDGALIGAVYSGSTRTQTVALTRPTDAAQHRYAIFYRGSRVYFELDSVTVGSIAFPNPAVGSLPACAVSVNAAAGAPGTAAVLQASVIGVADTGRNATQIADGNFPWREATVSAAGALSVSAGTAITALDAAPNVDTNVAASGIGPGWDRKQDPAGVSATSTASAVTVTVDGASSIAFQFTTIGTTPGSMIFEYDNGFGTWLTHGSVLKLGSELWISGAFVPAAGDVYLLRTSGIRQVRVRVNAVYASGTVTVKWTGAHAASIIKAMDAAPQPHNIGQAILNYQSASVGVVATSQIIAATTGKQHYITAIRISTGGTVAGTVAIYSATAATAFTEGTSQTAFMGEFAPSATSKPGAVLTFPVPWNSGTAGQTIHLTTTGITANHIQIQYYLA